MNDKKHNIAIIFSMIYALLTIMLILGIFYMAKGEITLPEWANTLLSAIWGGYTAKMTSILDYYFGNSAGATAKQIMIDKAINNQVPDNVKYIVSSDYEGDMKIAKYSKGD